MITSTTTIEDPFVGSPPHHRNAEPASPPMSLEDTLESLRVQTEQLLEVHDDILAENKRWSHRLSGLRSNRNTPVRSGGNRRSRLSGSGSYGGEQAMSSPLRAAS